MTSKPQLDQQTKRLLLFCAVHSLDVPHADAKRSVAADDSHLARVVRILNWAHCAATGTKRYPFSAYTRKSRPKPKSVQQWLSALLGSDTAPLRRDAAEMLASMSAADRATYYRAWADYICSGHRSATLPKLLGSCEPDPASSLWADLQELYEELRQYSAPPDSARSREQAEDAALDGCTPLLSLSLQQDAPRLSLECLASAGAAVDPTNTRPTPQQLTASLDGYTPEVRGFLEKRLAANPVIDAQWKLGLRGVQPPNAFLDSPARLVVVPLSYAVTEAFNRAYVRRLTARHRAEVPAALDDELDVLIPACAAEVVASTGAHNLPFPSQLFVEVAVVSADDRVLLVRKADNPGVVAGVGRSWTCGPEYGLILSDLEAGSVDMGRIIRRALNKEFGAPEQSVVDWHIDQLVLQRIHLNSALTGWCRVDLDSEALLDCFMARGREHDAKGQRDPFLRKDKGEQGPRLVPLRDLASLIAPEKLPGQDEWWHPTAKLRLQSALQAG